ncbi:MAG: enoyl-CoA hydratase/isomerase family protein [Dehalococcoidia bacterium]|nr:enoyl-CoA hydratase/isomerase family protein [Dehalococcoidia bacterium]
MPEEPVLYEAAEGLATITLNRPDVLNALTPDTLAALRAAVGRAAGERMRAVLLTGAGRGFSAGMDLASIKDQYGPASGPDFVALLRDHFHPTVRALRGLDMPVVAAVNGVAAGAGMSLALACDVRLAADNARFATAFTRIGLVPDCGMAWTLPRLAGAGRASYLLLSGEQIDAAAALAAGVVDRVVPAAQLQQAASDFAGQLAAGPTRAFVITRQLLDRAQTASFDELLEFEATKQADAGGTRDHRNAVAAFLRKETPLFEGR